ncbi:MAG: hypothetical protein FIA95_00730 [Gemmatimonadetes bacterium]|nr:hypothetical protein [Gemmatimonadota bacterium]
MGSASRWLGAALLPLPLLGAPVAAQEPPPAEAGATLARFFDCQGFGCRDMDYFRRELPFLNWVRDREVSDVHVIVSSQGTGGGGQRWTLRFLGAGRFEGQDQELVVSTAGDASDDDVRRALAAQLRLGLGRYLAGTPLAERLVLALPGQGPAGGAPGPAGPPPGAPPQDDPWDFWVFTLRGNAFLNGESSYSSSNLSSSVSANRTTDAWKLNLQGRVSRNRATYEIEGEDDVVYTREDWSTEALAVKSVTDRFSVGARAAAGKSTYTNEDFRWSVSPGVELNAFPYSESSRRSLTFQALLNVRHWDYAEETIFGETAETRVAPSLSSQLSFIQPWGRASISLDHSRYLHDTDKWRVTLGANLEVRVFRGFSVNLGGDYGWVRDQLYIASEGATQEEILLRQRALATDFEYFTTFGISYRFGSIFNNVVNPRFGGSGGGGMIIMMGG